MEKKKKSGKKWLPWIALALVAAILASLPVLVGTDEQESGAQAKIVSAEAEIRDIDTILVGGGQLESSDVYNVKIPEEVKIKEYLVGNGDIVESGDAIARVDRISVMSAISKVQETLDELSAQINDADSSSTTTYLSSAPSGRVKKVYGQSGDSVEDVMLEHGALAVIALDDTMAVKVKANTKLSAGDKVSVVINGTTVAGRVKGNVSGELTVTVADNSYSIGTVAEVSDVDGNFIGSGELYVYNAWNVSAYSGTISYVYIREEQTIYQGQTLFAVSETGKSAEYQKAIDKRHKYETLLHELFVMYDSGVLTAPCDGIVSGVDSNGTYMLSAGENDGWTIMLLSEETTSAEIISTELTPGTVGTPYEDSLCASVEGTWSVSGLPAGLSCSESGVVSGTPSVAGDFTLTVVLTPEEGKGAEATVSLHIEKKTETYYGYVAKVTESGGEVIAVMRTENAYSITDLDKLPNVKADSLAYSVQETYIGQAVVDAKAAKGDYVWVILNEKGEVVKVQKINTNPGPGGGGGSGMPNMGGGGTASGFGVVEEDDGLYTLEKLTVAVVTSQEEMTISITIDELDITKIYVGQTAMISMNAFGFENVEAVVKSISNSGENSGGNSKFTVELELAKSSEMLPGMNANATITLGTTKDAISVPSGAVYEMDGKNIVYTGYDEKNEQLIDPVEVTIGTADADYVQIISGIEKGITVWYETFETATVAAMPPMMNI